MKKKLVAVLTGDLIKSTSLTILDLNFQFELIRQSFELVGCWDPFQQLSKVERFRGDGWQVALSNPKWCLRACLITRACLRARGAAFDTRISVGVGFSDISSFADLAAARDDAFVISGRALDHMSTSRTNLSFDTLHVEEELLPLISAIFALCDSHCSSWTLKQSEIMSFFLRPSDLTQADIGRKLSRPTSQQVVARQISASGGFAIKQALEAFEQCFPPDSF